MYKHMQSGCEILWEPLDKNLGFDIVEEVTGKRGTEENPTVVTDEQREKIHRLYEERNHDPKPDEEEKGETPEVSKAEIMLGMTSMYEEFLQKDSENKITLAELYEMNLKEEETING